MKKRIFIGLCIVIILVTVGVAYATLSTHYNMPQTAIAPVGISASFTVNGQPWVNNTAIDWGQLVLGPNTIPITVTNTGSVAIASVTIINTGLPAGWTETLVMGTPSGSSIPGTITLTADSSVSGTQTWSSSLILTSP